MRPPHPQPSPIKEEVIRRRGRGGGGEESAGPAGPGGASTRPAQGALSQEVGQVHFFLVAENGLNPRKGGDFLRSPLGIAAGDQDRRAGVLPGQAADSLAGLLIGPCGDGAGVDHEIRGHRPGRAAHHPEAMSSRAIPAVSHWFTLQPKVMS